MGFALHFTRNMAQGLRIGKQIKIAKRLRLVDNGREMMMVIGVESDGTGLVMSWQFAFARLIALAVHI